MISLKTHTTWKLFDFTNLTKGRETFSNEKERVVAKFKIETAKSICLNDFICLGRKAYSFKCGSDNKNKKKGFSESQSKNLRFEEYYNYLQLFILRKV